MRSPMPEESAAPILMTAADGIVRITLNRPERGNAFDGTLHGALRDALDRIEGDHTCRVLILTGAGKHFCAGQNLAERASQLQAGPIDLSASLDANYNPLIRRLAALPIPVIAAVNGPAAGAGASLAIASDLAIAKRSARFQFSFAKVGLGLDCGASWLLLRRIGEARALGLALTADSVNAEEAAKMGLIWKAVEDDAFATEVESLARGLARGPRAALAVIKRQLRQPLQSLDEALEMERTTQGQLGRSPDYREAVTAFVARRQPKFSDG